MFLTSFKDDVSTSLSSFNDNVSTFEKLLEQDNSLTIHVTILRISATALYKTKENLTAPIMHEVFEKRNIRYNLRSQTDFQLGSVKRLKCGLRALRYRGPKLWNIVPFGIKTQDCPCDLCQPYFHCLRYI